MQSKFYIAVVTARAVRGAGKMGRDKYGPSNYERSPGHPAEISDRELIGHLVVGLLCLMIIAALVLWAIHVIPYGIAGVPATLSTLPPFTNDVPATVVEQHAIGSNGAVQAGSVSVSAHTHGFANPGGIQISVRLDGLVYNGRTPETILITAGGTQIYEGWYDGGRYISGKIPFEQADQNDDGRVRFVFIAVGDDGHVLARSVAIVRYGGNNQKRQ
jgi:hypothetical protein